ncbi:MAG: universal stress protein [Hyphomicrobiaceae bacterium]
MQLKAESGCQVTVLHVVEHGLTAHIRERRAAEALDELTRWKDTVPELSQIALNVKVSLGDPFATILEAIHAELPDLAIVGQPGKPNLKEFFTGTTAERVMRLASAPFLW